jgi:hypothetical protein
LADGDGSHAGSAFNKVVGSEGLSGFVKLMMVTTVSMDRLSSSLVRAVEVSDAALRRRS